MDFIFNLPKTKDKETAILVVVDKLSKRAHFIALSDNNTAENIAEVFYKEVYKHHGLPRKIISDGDSKFTAKFWKELTKIVKLRTKSFDIFPSSNGRTV